MPQLPAQIDDAITHRWRPIQLLVVALCFLINAIDGMDVLVLSYVAPSLSADWGVNPTALGLVFSSGLAGMALGGIVLAPLADRFGRRPLIIAALTIMTACMLLSAAVSNIGQLVALRFIVGSGIGTVLASMAAMTAEYAPARHRALAVGTLQAGYPIGAVLTGFVVAWILPSIGWQGVLLGAGLVSLLLLPLVIAALPESLAFLVLRGRDADHPRIAAIRQKLGDAANPGSPGAEIATDDVAPPSRATTLLLWGAVFCGFMVLYFIVSWVPRLAIDAGLSPTHGIYAGAVYNIGAFVGTVGLGFIALRFRLAHLIPIFLIAAATLMLAFGGLHLPVAGVMGLALLLGMALQGGFNGLYPLAANLYPARSRSSGIGRAMGVGRAGAVVGPLLGGYLLAKQFSLIAIFGVFVVPLVLAALCSFLAGKDAA